MIEDCAFPRGSKEILTPSRGKAREVSVALPGHLTAGGKVATQGPRPVLRPTACPLSSLLDKRLAKNMHA
eukprot:7117103-Lingulodinium_polyedra.AAC.1